MTPSPNLTPHASPTPHRLHSLSRGRPAATNESSFCATRVRDILLTLVFLAATACGGGGQSQSADLADELEQVTLRVLIHQNPPMVSFVEDFNERFEATNAGISIDLSVVRPDDLVMVGSTRLGMNDVDVITIFGFSNSVQPYMREVPPPYWQTLIEAGLLMDLTGQPFVNNYDETAVIEAGSLDGRVYSVTLGRVAYSGMFVNQDLLAQVGVDIPTTWNELVAVCDAVSGSSDECMTVGGADRWPIHVGSYGLLGSFYPDQERLVQGLWTGTIKWNDDTSLELWRRYHVYATQMLEDSVNSLTHDSSIYRFADGDVAFTPTGTWQAAALESAKPDFDWTYIPFPGGDDPDDNQYLFGKYDAGWAIAADTPHPEVALAYLSAFSEPDNYQQFVNAVGFLPAQPTATLDSQLGSGVAGLLDNFRIGYEQLWSEPPGAGQWANGSHGPSWFAPFDRWHDPVALADQVQADLQAGLLSVGP